MADTDARNRNRDHAREEDWVDFANQRAEPGVRARLEQHLEKGCPRCERTLRLWKAVLDAAHDESQYAPPEEALHRLAGEFARRRPRPLLERVAEQVSLVFDSFRQPLPAGVRSAGLGPRQLIYSVGRYTIRLRVEPAAHAERLSIVGQILDEQDPPTSLQDIAVLALKGTQTLDRTLTNHLGEFVLEPDAAENLRLRVGLDPIGTFSIWARRWYAESGRTAGGDDTARDGDGRRNRARRR
jgi:hypothetical protein